MVRHKNRYIVIELKEVNSSSDTPLRFHPAALHGAVFHTVQYLHGDFGAAAIRAGFVAKYCNPQTRIAVIRARHGPHRLVASALPYIKNIDNVRVNVFSLYMGATIRHCYKFILNYQKQKFEKYCLSLKTEEEKNELKKALFNLDTVLKIR
ncbi:hypothetical protein WA026_003148 [Henosepilachna vigintioctopunctata]|uniref:Ribonuclease P/MRP protein subunit POP5 n=1 Tax=Henosepilachna vigintioctopunctata TaxID=420089 RepID=A0AAW1TM98_9CUCU